MYPSFEIREVRVSAVNLDERPYSLPLGDSDMGIRRERAAWKFVVGNSRARANVKVGSSKVESRFAILPSLQFSTEGEHGEGRPWIYLATWSNVIMAEDSGDVVGVHDSSRDFEGDLDLLGGVLMPVGEVTLVLVCSPDYIFVSVGYPKPRDVLAMAIVEPTCIIQLNSDGVSVEAKEIVPMADTSVPCDLVEGDTLGDATVSGDDEMGRGLGIRLEEPVDGMARIATGSVVDNEIVVRDRGTAYGVTVVGRGEI